MQKNDNVGEEEKKKKVVVPERRVLWRSCGERSFEGVRERADSRDVGITGDP